MPTADLMILGPADQDAYLRFIRDMVRLKLWFLWHWLAAHPAEPFSNALRWRIDIWRKTDFSRGSWPREDDFQTPGWLELEREAQAVYAALKSDANAARFEDEALALFWPALERGSRPEQGNRKTNAGFQCHSLQYAAPSPETPSRVAFHILNAVQPRSMLDDKTYLARCFLCLMEKSEREFAATEMTTWTWLNEHPGWLAMLPAEFRTNLGPPAEDVAFGLGWWGQFINARGEFNAKLGERLRATGRFPFYPRAGWCTFAAARSHLAQFVK